MFTVYKEALTPGKGIHIKLGFCSQIKTVEKNGAKLPRAGLESG